MPYVVAALVLVGVLGLLNLVLTFGVIRRLRAQGDLLAASGVLGGAAVIPAGTPVGPFSAVTVDGAALTADSLTGETVVGFFSPNCGPCEEAMPSFEEYARRAPDGRRQVVAVVVPPPGEGPDGAATGALAARLAPVARVVVHAGDGPMVTAFGVDGYPTLAIVENGTVAASGTTVAGLPGLRAVARR